MKKNNYLALLPIGVFLIVYLGLGILFEYILGIEMGFYSVPVVGAFLIAIIVACFQNKKVNFDKKLEIMAKGVGDKNIITMLLIFLAAGAFAGIVGRDSASSVAYFLLSFIPSKLAIPILFIVACFVSTAMGTSCGTITILVPIALPIAEACGYNVALCIATVMGGAMFGDNLSFISDTTIAACNGQGVEMKDKFRENFFIALPAAILTLVVIVIISLCTGTGEVNVEEYNLVKIIPYIIVLGLALAGINVFIVLIAGILSGTVVMLATGTPFCTEVVVDGKTSIEGLIPAMGSGISGMFEVSMVAILVAALCGLIRENGGFEALLSWAKRVFKGNKGGQLGVGLLVGAMDIATANNTVAIVMANPIAKQMSEDYGISPKKTASLLDTFSCIFQGIIPYGAQMLMAIAAASDKGITVSAFQIIPFLFYPFALLLSSLVFIFIIPERKAKKELAEKNN